jgi:exodeoxyribonuclease V alpha subunit
MPAANKVTTEKAKTLKGTVERIFYSSERWSSGRLIAADGSSVSFAGNLMVQPGDQVILSGSWEQHSKYGLQFKVVGFAFDQNLGAKGLAHYLANNPAMKGIGPVKARLIAEAFANDFDQVVEHEPERIAKVGQVPLQVALALKDEWLRTRSVNAAMTWLSEFGLTHYQVTKLVERFDSSVVTVLKKDPYLLMREVDGFGFKRVDEVAVKMGVPRSAPGRLRAGIIHCVRERLDSGDCWIGYEDLVEAANKQLILDVPESRALIEAELDAAIEKGELACESLGGRFLVALPAMLEMERDLAAVLAQGAQPNTHLAFLAGSDELAKLLPAELNEGQRRAVEAAVKHRLVVISGAAGSGKTRTVSAIVAIAESQGLNVAMAAPTGKAAKRLEQVVGKPASTLHRLLEYDGKDFGEEPEGLDNVQLLIVDEVSMVDVPLAWNLFKRLDIEDTAVVLVGDHNQLPPVGPGNLLRDLIDRRPVPTVVLDQVVRQAGVLRENSLAVLKGEVRPSAPPDETGRPPWIRNAIADATPERVQAYILELFESKLVEKLGFDLLDEVQLLSPQRKGPLGTEELNKLLQRLVQRKLWGVEVAPTPANRRPAFLLNDRVIQIRNNYTLNVMNGSIGLVVDVGAKGNEVAVKYDDGVRFYSPDTGGVRELELAYALTIHKCVTGDTLVATGEGLKPIRELAKGVPEGRVAEAHHRVAGARTWAMTDQVFAGGVEPTIRVRTRAGYSIEGSHRHPVLVATPSGERVWRRLPELQNGDVLVLRRGVKCEGKYVTTESFSPSPSRWSGVRARQGRIPSVIDEELGWLLGVLVGDGNQTDKTDGRVEVAKDEVNLLRRLSTAAELAFGVRTRLRTYANGSHCPSVYFHGRMVREFLDWAGLGYDRAPKKHVPWSVFASPLSVQRAFLRGLFDSDGGASHLVHFTTTSFQLAFEVQQLLLNSGIISRRYCMRPADPVRHWLPAYRVEIMGDEIRLFRNTIGFSHQVKQKRLDRLGTSEEPTNGGKSNWGVIPHGQKLAQCLRQELRERSGRNYPEAKLVGALLSRVISGVTRLNIWHARDIAASIPRLEEAGPAGAEIKAIWNDGNFFDPIVASEKGEAEVFDLHVPDGNVFVGNGFLNHNSQGAEFPCAVVVVQKAHSFMAHRNLLYTAVTRARKTAILVGDLWGMRHCAEKEEVDRRKTFLSVLELSNSHVSELE